MATLNIKDFPDKLAKALKKRAQRERRSVSQEAIVLLERALADERPTSILALKGLGKGHWEALDADAHVAAEREAWDP